MTATERSIRKGTASIKVVPTGEGVRLLVSGEDIGTFPGYHEALAEADNVISNPKGYNFQR